MGKKKKPEDKTQISGEAAPMEEFTVNEAVIDEAIEGSFKKIDNEAVFKKAIEDTAVYDAIQKASIKEARELFANHSHFMWRKRMNHQIHLTDGSFKEFVEELRKEPQSTPISMYWDELVRPLAERDSAINYLMAQLPRKHVRERSELNHFKI